MNARNKTVLALLIYWITGLLSVPSQAEQNAELQNPYHLITEQQIYPENRLQHFWSTRKQGFFAGVEGIRISYQVFLHSDNTKAILIVNGRTESYIKYRQLAYELYQLGYSIYLYDHRGQGFSGRLLEDQEMGHVKNFNHYVEDLKTFYNQQVAPQNHNQKFMISHSMGGTVSLLYAEKYPQDIQAIALSSPMLGLDNEWLICPLAKGILWVNDLFGGQPDYTFTQAPYHQPKFKSSDPKMLTHSQARYEQNLTDYRQYSQIKLGGVTGHWLAQSCNAMQKVKSITTKLKTPLMLLQASEDSVVSLSAQNDFCHQLQAETELSCGGRSGKPNIIQGGYHELLIEEDRYRLPTINTMLDFFQRIQ